MTDANIEMDPKFMNLRTPEACDKFIRNALRLGRQDLADQARRHAVRLRAESHEAETEVERECLQAIYAYEEGLTRKNGKRTRASRTWQMISRHGILMAVERSVDQEAETSGYTVLAEMGLQGYTFEAVILRYPQMFSDAAVERSRERMQKWERTTLRC